MTAAKIEIHANGARRQTLSAFDLEVRGKTDADALIVGVEDVLRGLALAMENQVDGLRKAGVHEDTITRLLVDVWPFKKEES